MSDNSSIQEAIRGWRDNILQLDRRNNRVYFKFTQSAVEIQNLSVSSIDAWVASEYSAAYRFKYAESDPFEEDSEPPVHLIQQRKNARYQEEPPELRKRLYNLYKKNRLWEEEQGVSVLYLAVGFLEWVDEGGVTAHAPLVLIPCKLERSATREPFTLTGRDDPEMNETLRHILSKNYGVELSGLTGQSIADVLNVSRQAVESRPGWSIRERIILNYFYSSKLAMYADLNSMSKEDKHHPLIRSLAVPTGAAQEEQQETEAGAFSYGGDFAGGKLDDLLPLRDQYAILDADYSQLLTIDSAMKGKHLVVHGPPGTGKSQTIANLIATYLAKGKRILFVSEKKAALDVVKRKLVDCGLGVFCLDLHSGARKGEVYEQLRKSRDAMFSPKTNFVANGYTSEKLTDHRDRLNRYVRELHTKRKPLGISLFDALGRFEKARHAARHVSIVRLNFSDINRIEAGQLEEIERLIGNLAQRGDNFRAHHENRQLWGVPKLDALPLVDPAALIQARLWDIMEAVDSARQTLSDLADWAGVPTPETAEECRQTANLLDLLSRGKCVPERWLNNSADETNRADYGHWKDDLESRMRERKRLLEIYDERIIDKVSPDMLDKYRRGCRSFLKRLGGEWRSDQRLLKSLQISSNKLSRDAQIRSLEDALNIQRGCAEWLQKDSQNSGHLRERFPDFKPLSFEDAAEMLERFTDDFEQTIQLRDNWNASQTLLRSLLTSQEAHGDLKEASEYKRAAESMQQADSAVSTACAELDKFFDIQETPLKTWETAPFDKLRSWAENLHRNAGGIPAYLEYEADARGLEMIIGNGALDRIRDAADDATLIPDIVRRALYGGWIDGQLRSVPELIDFNRIGHERIIDEFRQLDKQQTLAAQRAVQTICFENYEMEKLPKHQYELLGGQLSRQRGQMSAHQLLKRIPDLLGKLKPCMLMSPLAVSQYLPRGPYDPDRLLFDAVVFDEASQILPEDAVPAIARAKQTIVVGDEKQLPPTSFFRGALDDEEPNYDDENYEEDGLAGRESILDAMKSMVGGQVEERQLNVHYRSRHEDLIRFSNHYYYGDKLLTFPAPRICLNGEEVPPQKEDKAETQALGVHSVYLPDARYDAGGTSTNPDEAEKVVEIVFDLMRTRPDHESVGVVALSSKQADEIERRIERHRLENRDLDARFDEERHDRFFVKNLENVQGDERDHIILCVGYGPTKGSGAVPNRFGPINLEGGERRLNVAVSRARRQTIVVHSLRPGDIRADNAKYKEGGVLRLKQYLEYIRNPRRAFESERTDDRVGEPESPFEEQVKRALEDEGHVVDSQIGVSGYRIDLGIRSKDGSGYVLGVECDGATYHSSPAARDRDRQRQAVLEGLGWKIHRVWSTAWAKNREKELEAIENALRR